MEDVGLDDIVNFLRENGVAYKYYEFTGGVRTVGEAAKKLGCSPSDIAKNIVFSVDGECIVVICRGDGKVSLKKLSSLLGREVRLASREEVFRATGYQVGGVPPFNHANKLRVLIDAKVLEKPEIITSGGSPNVLISLRTNDLIRLSGGEVADISE